MYVFSMKIAARCLIAVVMLAAASFALAHPFKSKIITTTPLMITVGDEAFLRIKISPRKEELIAASFPSRSPEKMVAQPMFSLRYELTLVPEAIQEIFRKLVTK